MKFPGAEILSAFGEQRTTADFGLLRFVRYCPEADIFSKLSGDQLSD
jgi:hypothetical protein